VPAGAVLLSKLNPQIERVWLPDVGQLDRPVCSTEFVVLTPRPGYPRSYLYCLLKYPGFRERLQALVTGTSGSHQRAPVDAILNLATSRVPFAATSAFDALACPFVDRLLANQRESRNIAGLRDVLLPKLVSGEVSVRDVEQLGAWNGV
jgi:type I restriction enzyme S subunit